MLLVPQYGFSLSNSQNNACNLTRNRAYHMRLFLGLKKWPEMVMMGGDDGSQRA